MIKLSPEAEQQRDDLLLHYEQRDRLEASENLLAVVEAAKSFILTTPEMGLPAPRPYPSIKSLGRLWGLKGAYRISYSRSDPPVILNVIYARADIPNRL